jgi:cell division protein FtsQ
MSAESKTASKPTTKTPKKGALGKPRKRATPVWRNRWLTGALCLVMVALSVGGIWWGVASGIGARMVDHTRWQAIAVSSKMGFRVNEILVVGRSETKQKELRKAMRLDRGAPILAYDLEAARIRVEALPWVRRATVERMLPDTVLLTLEERKALAIWQNKGSFALIDDRGEIIKKSGLERFGDLVVVVGEDAPVQTAELLATLDTQPELRRLVKAAVWVGGRRWNLRLTGDIDVRLPEDDTEAAWTRLAEYERSHQVLERDVQILDLRIPDRLIVRKSPSKKLNKKASGQET